MVTTDFNTLPNRHGGSDDYIYGLAVDPAGRITVVGSTEHEVALSSTSSVLVPDFALARYTPTGQLDTDPATGFGPVDPATGLHAGRFTVVFPGGGSQGGSTARAVAVLPDGKLVVAGYAYSTVSHQDFALARYNGDGSPDTTFGPGGTGLVTTPALAGADYARAMVVQGDGKIVLAGSASNGADLDFAAVRYNPDGTLDGAFGTGGKVTTAFTTSGDDAIAVDLQADGRIVASGNASRGFALARYLGDPPAAPANVAAAAVSASQINLSWAVTAAGVTASYRVERSTDGTSFTHLATVGGGVLIFSDTGLSPNTRYYYRVPADNGSGSSPFSAVVSALTPEG